MKKKIISCLLAITMMAAWTPPVFASEEGPAVAVWVSKVNVSDSGMEKGLEQQTPLQFRMDDGVNISNLITVEENNTYQTMDGFGASITEASAHLYQTELSNQQQITRAVASLTLLATGARASSSGIWPWMKMAARTITTMLTKGTTPPTEA